MNDAQFFANVERTDAELSSVPLILRPLDVYHRLVGREVRDHFANDCFQKIHAWYLQRYGKAAEWDGVLARHPVFLRGKVHILKIVHPEASPPDGLQELIGILAESSGPVSEQEFEYLAMNALESSHDFGVLHNLEMRPSLLGREQRALMRRAWFDLRDAVAVLESSSDVQGSIVHSHEAAEKFLKIAALHEGHQPRELGKRALRHDLPEIVKVLRKDHRKYLSVKKQANTLCELLDTMNARYSEMRRTASDAANAFRLARHCCAFVAAQVLLDDERKAKEAVFKPGHFYRNTHGEEFRFCGTARNSTGVLVSRLFALESKSFDGHTIDALVAFRAPCEFNFVEVTDKSAVTRLEKRFSFLQRQKRDVRENQASIRIAEDSLHAMAFIRIPTSSRIS